MNVAVVRRATAGLAAWLARRRVPRRRSSSDGTPGTARRRSPLPPPRCSRVPGSPCTCCRGPLPTPVLAFAVRHAGRRGRRADHGVAQPAADNGYKVYLADGAQLVAAGRRRDRGGDRRGARRPVDRRRRRPRRRPPTSPRPTSTAVGRLPARRAPGTCGSRSPRCTASAARRPCRRCAGPGSPTSTSCTRRPCRTPDFPTVAFPNPEEPGATDLLLALAAEVGADLAIALDPDADRCAARPSRPRRLADADRRRDRRAARRSPAAQRRRHRPAGGDDGRLVVDARRDRRGARRALRRDADRVQVDRPRRGPAWCSATRRHWATASTPTPSATRTASPRPSSPATSPPTLKAAGQALPDRLDALARQLGVHATAGVSVRMATAERDAVVERLRAAPPDGWTVERPAPDVLVLRREGERLVGRVRRAPSRSSRRTWRSSRGRTTTCPPPGPARPTAWRPCARRWRACWATAEPDAAGHLPPLPGWARAGSMAAWPGS